MFDVIVVVDQAQKTTLYNAKNNVDVALTLFFFTYLREYPESLSISLFCVFLLHFVVRFFFSCITTHSPALTTFQCCAARTSMFNNVKRIHISIVSFVGIVLFCFCFFCMFLAQKEKSTEKPKREKEME